MNFRLNTKKEIENILKKAREFNSANNITGQLLYRSGVFVQILEGEKSIVEGLMGRIVLDRKRHENVKVVLNQTAKERIFPEWSMNFKEVDDESLSLIKAILPWQEIIDHANQDKPVPQNKITKVFEKLRP